MKNLPDRVVDYRLNTTVLRVMYGNITLLTTDALVSSDDNYLSMGGGISYALWQAGGDIVIQEARKHAPVRLGDVAVTSAGQLSAKYIFHAVTIDYDKMQSATKESIEQATLKCLQLADTLNVRVIAFPALGTGVAKFPFQLSAEIMTRTIADYLMGITGIELVIITLFPREMVSIDDLNLFFERSVALASLYTQSKRLNLLISELGKIIGEMNMPTLFDRLADLQKEVERAQKILAESPSNIEQLKQIQDKSDIAEVSQKVVAISSDIQDVAIWDDKQLEARLLRTKLSGLLTQLNIHSANLNHYQIEKAKYGTSGTPSRIEWAIDDSKKEISELEKRVGEVRLQLAALGQH